MKLLLASVILSALLTACGGGGSDTSVDPNSFLQQFAGTWRSGCYEDVDITESDGRVTGKIISNDLSLILPTGPAKHLNAIKEITVTRIDNTHASVQLTYSVYGVNDVTCQNRSLGSIVYTGQSAMAEKINLAGVVSSYGANTATLDGEATLSDGKVVQRMTLAMTKLIDQKARVFAGDDGAGHSGFSTTSLEFPAFTAKGIVYINDSTANITLAPGENAQIQAYPTALLNHSENTYKKK